MSVYMLDDDAGVRTAMNWAFQPTGFKFCACSSVDQLLAEFVHDGPSCLILDLQLNGITGFECLNDAVFKQQIDVPVIVLTGTGEVSDVVKMMKLGVVDFLEKPVHFPALLNSVREALRVDTARMHKLKESGKQRNLLDRLTNRDRQLVGLMCEGYSSKQIASEMGISVNTVSNHRARLRKKTQATNTAELIRIVISADAA